MKTNADEAETEYGLLAEVVELPADRMGVAFELRPEAKFNDGTPVTAEDVAWTFETCAIKAVRSIGSTTPTSASVTVEGPRRVVFRFKSNTNRELPLILGQMAVLPKHWWAGRDFDKPLNDPPLGSGPYRVGSFEFGRSLSLERVPDVWSKDLPVMRGLANFDTRRTEYFRDGTVALEAFKAGQIDFREENVAKDWATAYDFPAVQKGLVKKELLPHHLPTGMQGYGMNTRRAMFKDVRVRHALAMVFDFEWANANLFYGSYVRTNSYFSNSDLASSGIPQGDELALLNKYRDQLPPGSVYQTVPAAGDRRLRQQSRGDARCAGSAGAGRMEGARPKTGRCRWPAVHVSRSCWINPRSSVYRYRMCNGCHGWVSRRACGLLTRHSFNGCSTPMTTT